MIIKKQLIDLNKKNRRLKTRNNKLQEKIDSITKENEIILQDNKRQEVKTDELLKKQHKNQEFSVLQDRDDSDVHSKNYQ